ncbi:MAG: ribosomal protein S18-alanine N-acetyltransferase [Mogibacterium sp.]|nr:ribosomal protein S18-alanine N-acetyltransferase [Mogibacterium sp.]
MSEIITVRRAVPEDADAIAEAEKLCFPMPWSRESILHDLVGNELALVLTAEMNGVFAGYLDIWRVAGEGQLNNIAVMPGMRGKHVGLLLMREAIRMLRESGDTEMTLEVRSGNEPAIRLYEKLGFETAGRRAGYYLDNGDDALLMRLDLSKLTGAEETE